MPFAHEPDHSAKPSGGTLGLLTGTLVVFLATIVLDAGIFIQAFFAAIEHHGKNDLNAGSVAAALSLLLWTVGLQVLLIIVLLRFKGFAQAAAAMVGLLPLLGLISILHFL
jgi:hypothetical protein